MPFELKVDPGEFLARVRGWGKERFAVEVFAEEDLALAWLRGES